MISRQKHDDDDDILALWYRHASPAYAGLLTHDGWELDTSDPTRIGYVSDTGTKLGPDQLRSLAIGFTTACELDLEHNAQDLLSGEIDVDEWMARHKQTTDDEIFLLAALGAGGIDELTDEDYATIRGRVTTPKMIGTGIADANSRLDAFADELSAEPPEPDKGVVGDVQESGGQIGQAGSEAQVVNRAGMYGRQFAIFESVRRDATMRLAQMLGLKLQERNRLNDLAKHCRSTEFTVGCPECTEQGWVNIGSLPDVGERSCGQGCLCGLEYRLAPEAV